MAPIRFSRPPLFLCILGALSSVALPCLSQTTSSPTPASIAGTGTTARSGSLISVALFDFAFFGKHANSIEPGDTSMAAMTTNALHQDLVPLPGVTLVDSVTLAKAAMQPKPQDAANGKPCNVIIACTRAAARLAGASWAITGTVSKTSNLIWIFSGQLINVATGKMTLDDEYELKGDSRQMMAQGAHVFARRVAKKLGLAPAT